MTIRSVWGTLLVCEALQTRHVGTSRGLLLTFQPPACLADAIYIRDAGKIQPAELCVQ